MTKKILILLSVIAIIVNTVAFASVTPTVVIDKCLIDDDYKLIVEVSAPGALKMQMLGLTCTDPDGNPVLFDQVTLTEKNENGDYTSKFYTVKFQPKFKSGEYTVEVFGKGVEKGTATVTFYGIDSWCTALDAIVNADGNDIITAAQTKAQGDATNAELLGVDIADVTKFTRTGEFFALVDNEDSSFDITGLDPTDDEDALVIQEKVVSFKKLWADSVRIGEYYNADTAEEVKNWFAKNQKIYDDNPTEENMRFDFNGNSAPSSSNSDRNSYLKESYVLNKYFDDLKSADKEDGGTRETSLYSALSSGKPVFSVGAEGNTWDEKTPANAVLYAIGEQLREEIILTTAKTMNLGYFDGILTNAPGVVDIDYSKYNTVSDKVDFYDGILGEDYNTLADLEKAINGKLDELDEETEEDTTPSRPTVGTGNGSISAGGSSKPNVAIPENAGGKYFADVSDTHWAATAINALYEKGVVNGKSSGGFDPEGSVTRSEFVKMLVCALGFSTDGIDSSFADLFPDMWQYSYVSAAYKLGIVNGFTDGRFGINDVITRQDMAVITERALRIAGNVVVEGNADFADIADISGYAVSAVKNLASLGIVTGMPDGSYAPMQNVSRAQAAAIIYRAINQ